MHSQVGTRHQRTTSPKRPWQSYKNMSDWPASDWSLKVEILKTPTTMSMWKYWFLEVHKKPTRIIDSSKELHINPVEHHFLDDRNTCMSSRNISEVSLSKQLHTTKVRSQEWISLLECLKLGGLKIQDKVRFINLAPTSFNSPITSLLQE